MQSIISKITLNKDIDSELIGLTTILKGEKSNCKTHYKGQLTQTINNTTYTLVYSEWTTWNGKLAKGWRCQVTKSESIADTTKAGLIEQIKEHKPFDNSDAAQWYGQGRYMGD